MDATVASVSDKALRAAYLLGYERGLNQEPLIGTKECNGRYYLVGDGHMAETTCRSKEDVLEYNRRYAAAQTDAEQIDVIRSVIVWSVKTR